MQPVWVYLMMKSVELVGGQSHINHTSDTNIFCYIAKLKSITICWNIILEFQVWVVGSSLVKRAIVTGRDRPGGVFETSMAKKRWYGTVRYV